MKRGRVANDLSMIQRGAGVHRVVPRGPCWILEGSHWVTLTWHEDDERQRAEISMRDYATFVEQGRIQFTTADDEHDRPLHARRADTSTRTSVLGMRLM
ncbi:MAG: hypothetical protein ABI605_17610 [Rhizobacter sp.]